MGVWVVKRMSDENRVLLKLIEQVYAAALDPTQWPIFLDNFAEAFRGEQATFFSHDLRNLQASFHACARIDEAFVRSYIDHYATTNIFVEKSRSVAEGVFISTEALVDRKTYEQCEFYNDWVKPQGCLEFATTNILRDSSMLTGVTVLRGKRPFEPKEAEQWGHLVPHLQRAIQVHRQLFSAQLVSTGTLEALDRLAVGAILTGKEANVLFCNRVAQRIMGANSNIQVRGGRLCGETLSATSLIQQTIRTAALTGAGTGTHPGAVLAVSSRSAPPLSLLVSPLHTSGPFAGVISGQGAMVLVADPTRKRSAQKDELSQIFGLTQAEARLLTGLVGGLSLAEYAETAGVSVQTARSQIKAIFAKTGVRRQSELMRLVLTDPILARPLREDGKYPEP